MSQFFFDLEHLLSCLFFKILTLLNITALLRKNLYFMNSYLKYIIQWLLVYAQMCVSPIQFICYLERSPILAFPAPAANSLLSVDSHYTESLITGFFDASVFKAHGMWHVLLHHFFISKTFIAKTLSQLSFRPVHLLESVPGSPPTPPGASKLQTLEG